MPIVGFLEFISKMAAVISSLIMAEFPPQFWLQLHIKLKKISTNLIIKKKKLCFYFKAGKFVIKARVMTNKETFCCRSFNLRSGEKSFNVFKQLKKLHVRVKIEVRNSFCCILLSVTDNFRAQREFHRHGRCGSLCTLS